MKNARRRVNSQVTHGRRGWWVFQDPEGFDHRESVPNREVKP